MRLPLDYREPLVLQVLGGFSTEEIARELSLSSTAVLTRLFRARNKLRALCGVTPAPDVASDGARHVTCDEARLLIGADPGASTPALEEHLQGCAGVRAFLRTEMRALDEQLRRALAQPPQSGRTRRAGPRPWRQWALAASVVLAILAAGALWLLRPSDTLARDVVAHVQGEPQSWLATQHVDAQAIATALHGAGVALDLTSDQIIYAQSCWFRGHYVPHLVVRDRARTRDRAHPAPRARRRSP